MPLVHTLKRVLRRLRSRRLHEPDINANWVELGSDYGGWPVIPTRLPHQPLVYAFGVGEDISFDLAIIRKLGATVHAFDPTPRSQEWVGGQSDLPDQFNFHPIGVGGSDGTAEFFPPAKENHVSFSNAPTDQQNGPPIVAEICTVETLQRRLGHRRIDVLKMDVEGFEYDVIRSLERADVRPGHLLVEFHHGMYRATDEDTLDAVARLRRLGYRLFFVSDTGREYGFVLGA
jgi:FkbM family methyltransferase